MSVVIIGGNQCMERQYTEICKEYDCKSKIFARKNLVLKNKIGSPDLLVLFTSTVSHKMVKSALSEVKGMPTVVTRCHTSSATALRTVLDDFLEGGQACPASL